MKTSAVTAADLARSVLAVPPLARNGDLTLNPSANAALIRHLEAGGVSTLMYGGNANFYNIGLYEYGAVLDFLEQTAAAESWVIPSVGPRFRQAVRPSARSAHPGVSDGDGAPADVSCDTGRLRKSDTHVR